MLPSSYVYGIGEKQDSLLVDLEWRTYTLFANDHVVTDYANLYGSHPFYIAQLLDGSAVGVYLHNSNAMGMKVIKSF